MAERAEGRRGGRALPGIVSGLLAMTVLSAMIVTGGTSRAAAEGATTGSVAGMVTDLT